MGKQAPQTTKGATQRLIDFSSIPDVQDAPSLTSKERLEYDYLKKRDPMREFFSLVSLFLYLAALTMECFNRL